MNHITGIFKTVKASIFPVLEGWLARKNKWKIIIIIKKGNSGEKQKDKSTKHPKLREHKSREAKWRIHLKRQFSLLIQHKLFMLPAYFSMRDGQVTLHLKQARVRQKHTEQMKNMSQSVLCKQTLQKRIGGIKLLFIKCSKPLLRSLFL